MKNNFKHIIPALVVAAAMSSCSKMQDVGILNQGDFKDTSAPLKSAASFTVGAAVPFNQMVNNPLYNSIVKRDFSGITIENDMKHSSIVQANGSLSFTRADAIINAAQGLEIFGHTLAWHSQQNASYLKSYAGITVAAATELINNGGFENGLTGWSVFNTNGATISAGSGPTEVRTGNGSMKVVNPTAWPGGQWRVQVSSSNFPTVVGRQYSVTYWVKAASAGGSIRLSTGPTNAQYQGDQTIGTNWQMITFTFTANIASTTFLFDMGQVANTYYIDDVSVKEVVQAPSGGQVAAKLDEALNNFITGMVTHFKGRVKAWDVVNEMFADNGAIRNNTNTNTTPADILVWSNYLGRDFGLKAFNYARSADPNALLFINDYNLEQSPAKLDSLIAYVAEIRARGAKVDGIGTQMHVNWNSNRGRIDDMMRKLAATGLLIRISELDVKANTGPKLGYVFTPLDASYQAEMYRYIVNSYMKHIPKAQQYGITVWGITDNTSWLYRNGEDFPLLYNADFSKKPAYAGFLKGLRGQ
ncbi:endo-1,4-beta-xylanase [Aridibaculum aurantiacum]|uniref:endo-1,4-beta-xylanase n=1 Tax=Aridibaculum aurantiacum TaxID=2810307 RepID=UPI001A97870F|nr:endo-1,4-beta-xylanase [Aridibaculum aurantiacum]